MARLASGRTRRPPLEPLQTLEIPTRVSVIVPTLNEEARISPCLEGLHSQGSEVIEILVIDSRSKDGTVAKVEAMAKRDPRFRVVYDDPLPSGWIGRPWALQYGFLQSRADSEWILGVDADTVPQPGLVAAVVKAARSDGYEALSLSPQFMLKGIAESWLQPALLITLIYRFGPTGVQADPAPERVMANGQCSLLNRAMMVKMDGYTCAKRSFCDDVTLARSLASRGVKVGFQDGAKLIKVRMYDSALETWNEWGRSLDLKDASTPGLQWLDVAFLALAQGLPIPVLIAVITGGLPTSLETTVLAWINGLLLAIRLLLLFGVRSSYDAVQWSFWLSPLADPLAALRILISTLSVPKSWRGRSYADF
jgi:dolichol-phosphate mannosyltransferase